MFLSQLQLWNFRKFGNAGAFDLTNPHLIVLFNQGLTLLIGENDSGKTAIIDAIKLVLKTHSVDWIKIEHEDFFSNATQLRIECYFEGLTDEEAKNFTEFLGWDAVKNAPFLKVFLDVSRSAERIFPADVKAGADDEGHILSAEVRDKIKTIYLRPLRDAENELSSRRNSRLSQILHSHEAFKDKQGHRLVTLSQELNKEVAAYFKGQKADGTALAAADQGGMELKTVMDTYLEQFSGKKTHFTMTSQDLKNILESLSLLFDGAVNLGLGSHNLLCIAAELLHLEKVGWDGLRLGLVEEIEAHLHPQIQMQVIEALQKDAAAKKVQLIFTTHSPNIGSKINLENLIICQGGAVFPMGKAATMLDATDYTFLQRFLDTTKANLFFARGVVLVEGWAEELLLPELARKIDINLTQKGVSVINIASTAFLRYANIFKRRGSRQMACKVALITDVDVKPVEAGGNVTEPDPANPGADITRPITAADVTAKIAAKRLAVATKYNGQVVQTYVSALWTLEYCLAMSLKLRKLFYKSVLEALLEQKQDDGVQNLTAYQNAITNIDSHFNNWTDPVEHIAYAIMVQILEGTNNVGVAQDKISKSIIAQRFASNLSSDTAITDLTTETSLTYLFDAIRYAASN
ncbi:MAG: AAA family ATPase [Puia sp.]|nr:AAA family ATPase [Puia sp.]